MLPGNHFFLKPIKVDTTCLPLRNNLRYCCQNPFELKIKIIEANKKKCFAFQFVSQNTMNKNSI